MLDRKILEAIAPPVKNAACRLLALGLRANHISWIGFILGLCSVPMIIWGQMEWALALILFNRLADGLDGAMARQSQPTDRGAFLDITLDFLFYSAVPLAFALANPAENALAAAVLIYSFIGTGCSFLAFAILAAKRGLSSDIYPRKGFYYLGGLTEATETICVFMLMCLMPHWFSVLAYGFATLCAITTVTRIFAAYQIFTEQG
ncbi:CDP-alcohol phosphatidyltransferase family protein [Iodobacter ciconiae]|uniref:CDP-alcohol phosphatidyltransferase family protein n=1 Tax=Iodobacter ciconiae TaxID=2496266 RepID=A0A3S8ZRR1_9NEIS|nr:CDP-alcohol phosphatidyltransferase family protein [Iodobacter ciconiae]AZN36179.1 CDP-alcohol phosphatidyltransferase family protein [Iodobacter ciconiae]